MRVVLLSLLPLLFTPKASAAEVIPEVNLQVMGSMPVNKQSDIGMFASVMLMPGAYPLIFTYVGPDLQVTKWWWSSLRIGMEIGLPTANDARPILSWWNIITTDDKRFDLFAEVDLYPDLSPELDPIFYGFYSARYTPGKHLSFGAQAEQVNSAVAAGPQIGLKLNDHLSVGAQHFWNFDDIHQIRVVVATTFN